MAFLGRWLTQNTDPEPIIETAEVDEKVPAELEAEMWSDIPQNPVAERGVVAKPADRKSPPRRVDPRDVGYHDLSEYLSAADGAFVNRGNISHRSIVASLRGRYQLTSLKAAIVREDMGLDSMKIGELESGTIVTVVQTVCYHTFCCDPSDAHVEGMLHDPGKLMTRFPPCPAGEVG